MSCPENRHRRNREYGHHVDSGDVEPHLLRGSELPPLTYWRNRPAATPVVIWLAMELTFIVLSSGTAFQPRCCGAAPDEWRKEIETEQDCGGVVERVLRGAVICGPARVAEKDIDPISRPYQVLSISASARHPWSGSRVATQAVRTGGDLHLSLFRATNDKRAPRLRRVTRRAPTPSGSAGDDDYFRSEASP